jgi:hypothetical protein
MVREKTGLSLPLSPLVTWMDLVLFGVPLHHTFFVMMITTFCSNFPVSRVLQCDLNTGDDDRRDRIGVTVCDLLLAHLIVDG